MRLVSCETDLNQMGQTYIYTYIAYQYLVLRARQPSTSTLAVPSRPTSSLSLFCAAFGGLHNRCHLYLPAHSHSLIAHPFHTSAPRTLHLTSSSLPPGFVIPHLSTSERDSNPRISRRQQSRGASGGSQSAVCVSALPEYAGALAGVAVAASVGALIFMNQEGISDGLKLNQVMMRPGCLFPRCTLGWRRTRTECGTKKT